MSQPYPVTLERSRAEESTESTAVLRSHIRRTLRVSRRRGNGEVRGGLWSPIGFTRLFCVRIGAVFRIGAGLWSPIRARSSAPSSSRRRRGMRTGRRAAGRGGSHFRVETIWRARMAGACNCDDSLAKSVVWPLAMRDAHTCSRSHTGRKRTGVPAPPSNPPSGKHTRVFGEPDGRPDWSRLSSLTGGCAVTHGRTRAARRPPLPCLITNNGNESAIVRENRGFGSHGGKLHAIIGRMAPKGALIALTLGFFTAEQCNLPTGGLLFIVASAGAFRPKLHAAFLG